MVDWSYMILPWTKRLFVQTVEIAHVDAFSACIVASDETFRVLTLIWKRFAV